MSTRGTLDEDSWEIPDAWLRAAHPPRDRPGPWPAARMDESAPAKARRLVDAARSKIEHVLALRGTTPALAEHGRTHLRGVECWISRRLGAGRYLVVDLDPGVVVGATDAAPRQTLRTARWPTGPSGSGRAAARRARSPTSTR